MSSIRVLQSRPVDGHCSDQYRPPVAFGQMCDNLLLNSAQGLFAK